MRLSLFRSGLAPRLGAAVLYGATAFGAVILLAPADSRPRAAETPPEGAPVAATATIRLDAVRPVAAWDVRVDGRAAAALQSDAHSWVGALALAPEATLVVEATPAAGAGGEPNALRIRISGTQVSRDQTLWCERDWSLAIQAGRLAPAPAPIDAEDLR